jgi:hypothetical protein
MTRLQKEEAEGLKKQQEQAKHNQTYTYQKNVNSVSIRHV